jgi:hypothetical protein
MAVNPKTRDFSALSEFLAVTGGIAGASAGFALADTAKVLRESQFGFHSTGRSAAVFLQTHGPDVIRALAIASKPFFLHRRTLPRVGRSMATAGTTSIIQTPSSTRRESRMPRRQQRRDDEREGHQLPVVYEPAWLSTTEPALLQRLGNPRDRLRWLVEDFARRRNYLNKQRAPEALVREVALFLLYQNGAGTMSLGKMPRLSADGLQLLSGRELRPLPFLGRAGPRRIRPPSSQYLSRLQPPENRWRRASLASP